MFGFSHTSPRRCAAIVDVGSGSVGISIVISDSATDQPEIVWSHREYNLLKESPTLQGNLKSIRTSLINAFLELGTSGMQALQAHVSGLHITSVQVSVAAPWSYTITRTVSINDEHPFVVTQEAIQDLVSKAQELTQTALQENKIAQELGVEVVHSGVTDVRLNGYSIKKVANQEGRTLSISFMQSAVEDDILAALYDNTNKIVPKAKVEVYSFMHIMYCTLQKLTPDTTEICLVDATNEATEIGIVRNGVLKHVTHTNFGAFTLARAIATVCNIPNEEAYTYLRNMDATVTSTNTDKVEAVVEKYENAIVALLKQTGDTLSIPKSIFLHSDKRTEAFFAKHIQNAAHTATTLKHTVHKITSQLLDEKEVSTDTALALGQYYFNKEIDCMEFAYEK